MASFDPQDDFSFDEPPPRPTTPPVRRGFLLILGILTLLASLVYGIPYIADRTGYAWEAGRARAATEALAKLDAAGVIDRASSLFRLASQAVAPAVVHINTQRRAQGGEAMGIPVAGNLPPSGFLPLGVGSGVVIDKANGYIVTNYHVVRGADRIVVRVGRGTEMPAREVGHDEKTDLAVLKVNGTLRAEAPWGDSDKVDIGEWVLAIGSPFNLDQTVTAGIISATGRSNLRIVGEDAYEDFIQTDAPINPGNSGGPLVDLTGKIIGINTAIFGSKESEGSLGIGLAISSNMARRVSEQIIKEGRPIRGYLGVMIQEVSPAVAEQLKLADPKGALIFSVQPGSPADQAGLRPGDVVVEVAGKPVEDTSGLRNRTAGLDVGTKVAVGFVREGKPQTVEVTIAEMPSAPALVALGFTVRRIPPNAPELPEGALVVDQVIPNSPAAQAGLVAGTRIVGVAGEPVRTVGEYERAIARVDLSRGLPLQVVLPDGRTGTLELGRRLP